MHRKITLANKVLLFLVFLTNFYFLATYSYPPTKFGKISTLSALSFAYYYVKDTSSEGHLTRLKVKIDSQGQTFNLEFQHILHTLK